MPQDTFCWQEIEAISRRIFSLYNFQEIRPPLLEEAVLFNRSLGESSEIIQKQMFLVKNKDGLYALRPEGTAGVVRAYIENNLYKKSGFSKFYYLGPMFRLERPQKGRLRQFHHIGCEAIGASGAVLDAEIIAISDHLLSACGIAEYKIKLNSLGCAKDKLALSAALRKELTAQAGKLCPDCRVRLKNNVLRILDCKVESCKEVVSGLHLEGACLCPECGAHFQQVKQGLEALSINYEISPRLVRGLDYYTRTIFEITHPSLGAQDALGAGGRYDNLVKELGGPDAGAVGFALGVERLLLVTSHKSQVTSKKLVYLITLGEELKKCALPLLNKLRKEGIACDTDYENKSLKGALRRANDLGAAFVLIIGEDELQKGVVMLKDMESGKQREIRQEDLIRELSKTYCSSEPENLSSRPCSKNKFSGESRT